MVKMSHLATSDLKWDKTTHGHRYKEVWLTEGYLGRLASQQPEASTWSQTPAKSFLSLPTPLFHYPVWPILHNKPLPHGTALAWCGLSGWEPRFQHNSNHAFFPKVVLTTLLGLPCNILACQSPPFGNLLHLNYKNPYFTHVYCWPLKHHL